MILTQDELEQQRLHPETLAHAIQDVRVNGYVIFERALPDAFLQELQAAYSVLFERYLLAPDPNVTNNHHRIDLPFRPPFNHELVIANPLIMAVIEGLLGSGCVCPYFASNTCMPGSDYQPVHSDFMPLFPESSQPPPPFHVVFNIPLVDTTENNGPMEIWPGGTHLSTIAPEAIARLAPSMPSETVHMPAGSLMIRDGRMWHRGTRNKSDAPRPNIALVYTRPWLRLKRRDIGIPQETYEALSERAQALFRSAAIGSAADVDLLA